MAQRVLSIVIPVYNERDLIQKVVEVVAAIRLPGGFEKEIIIVDDGSTDGTRDVLKNLEAAHTVLYHDKNQGKGGALHTGFAAARGDYVVIQDADFEYEPSDIARLLNVALENEGDIAYGSRNKKSDNNPFSMWYKWGGQFVTLFFNVVYQRWLTDINTCYKLFPRRILDDVELREKGFAFCEEFTCQVTRRGYVIREIPISYTSRTHQDGKKLKWWYGFRSLLVMLRNRFR